MGTLRTVYISNDRGDNPCCNAIETRIMISVRQACHLIAFYRVSITRRTIRFDASRVLRLIVISICHEF